MFTYVAIIVLIIVSALPLTKRYMKFRKFASIINRIPGPRSFPLIGSTYLLYGINRRNSFKLLDDFIRKYKYICRAWVMNTAEVGLNKAEYVEKIISSSSNMQKPWNYTFIKEWLGDGLLISHGEKWFHHRKVITPTFHFNILETFSSIFSVQSNIMVKNMAKHCGTNVPFDIYPYITKVTLDIIGEAAMGVKLNAQGAQSNEYLESVYAITELLVERIMWPFYHLDIIYNRTKSGKAFKKCLHTLHIFTDNLIKLRRENLLRDNKLQCTENVNDVGQKRKLAFLDMLLVTNLTNLEIRQEVDTFMFEGHDTTTVSICWTIFLLGFHPEYQEHCFDEIRSIFKGDKTVAATLQDFAEMKVLERVIKESLRLFPSVPFFGRILSEDVQLDQYLIPKDSTVFIHTYHLHRDERYFPDPEKFDPDRFLPQNTVDRHPYAYIPFSAGPRNCIGQKFAMYEEKSILSTLIRNYKFTTIGPRTIDIAAELVLKPMDGVQILLEKR